MAARNGKNNSPEVELKISEISIVNDHRLKPFVETFNIAPTNIVQQPLGNLFGFFKIKDTSEDSAYIVNFLASVLKKEYYINPKRSVEDSFDSALNKVNIALSEIAKNGNIRWMGTFESAVCVVRNNMFYFAVTGTAKIMLLRDQYLSNISEGLSSEDSHNHPIKTFINVSSGSIKARDKIIVTSEEIFEIFSETELKKNADRFPQDKFVQFLKTALVNELDSAETVVIDVVEKRPDPPKTFADESENDPLNFFSAKAYESKKSKDKITRDTDGQQEYTDKKTGHIYVRGENNILPVENRYSEIFSEITEKLGDFFSIVLKIISAGFIKLKKWVTGLLTKKPASAEITVQEKTRIVTTQNYLKKFREIVFLIINKMLLRFRVISPNFSKIKDIFVNLSYRQKIVGVVIILVFVIILPLIWNRKDQEKNIEVQPDTEIVQINNREILASDKNIRFDFAISIVDNQRNALAVEVINSEIVLLGQEKIILIKNGNPVEEFAIPGDQKIKLSCAMEDLKLIFLLTSNNKLLSFSPVSKEFKENRIELPTDGNIKTMAAYLTYLYLVDAETGNINRYPRAEGGFGLGVSWLKDNMDMDEVFDMAIDENIYLAYPGKIAKFFKGEGVEFNLENSVTPFAFKKIHAQPEYSNFYALDGQNGRIIALAKDGTIIAQYYDQKFERARDFAVDEKNNKVIVVLSDSSVIQFSL